MNMAAGPAGERLALFDEKQLRKQIQTLQGAVGVAKAAKLPVGAAYHVRNRLRCCCTRHSGPGVRLTWCCLVQYEYSFAAFQEPAGELVQRCKALLLRLQVRARRAGLNSTRAPGARSPHWNLRLQLLGDWLTEQAVSSAAPDWQAAWLCLPPAL